MTTNNSDSTWFDTVAAWAYAGSTPAQHLADDLRVAGKVASTDSDQPTTLGDEWGWLDLPEATPTLDTSTLLDDQAPTAGDFAENPVDSGLAVNNIGPGDNERIATANGRPRRRRRSRVGRPRGRVVAVGVAVTVVLVTAVAAGWGLFVGGGTSEQAAPQDPVEVLDDVGATAASEDDCPESVDGAVTTGNDAGDQHSGPGVIKAFDYAYYVDRSGERARALAVPNGVGSTQALQASIDALPTDTAHCLHISDRGSGLYAVKLAETRPGEQPIVYPQLIQTVQAAGTTWIASIKKDTP